MEKKHSKKVKAAAQVEGQPVKKFKKEVGLSYIDKVKSQFRDQPQVFKDFQNIMKEFRSQSIDTVGVVQRVSNLFRGHPELIVGFGAFLSPAYTLEVHPNQKVRLTIHSEIVEIDETSLPSTSSLPSDPTAKSSLTSAQCYRSTHSIRESSPVPLPEPSENKPSGLLTEAATQTSDNSQSLNSGDDSSSLSLIHLYQNAPIGPPAETPSILRSLLTHPSPIYRYEQNGNERSALSTTTSILTSQSLSSCDESSLIYHAEVDENPISTPQFYPSSHESFPIYLSEQTENKTSAFSAAQSIPTSHSLPSTHESSPIYIFEQYGNEPSALSTTTSITSILTSQSLSSCDESSLIYHAELDENPISTPQFYPSSHESFPIYLSEQTENKTSASSAAQSIPTSHSLPSTHESSPIYIFEQYGNEPSALSTTTSTTSILTSQSLSSCDESSLIYHAELDENPISTPQFYPSSHESFPIYLSEQTENETSASSAAQSIPTSHSPPSTHESAAISLLELYENDPTGPPIAEPTHASQNPQFHVTSEDLFLFSLAELL